jgi:uncharacterized membrane protein
MNWFKISTFVALGLNCSIIPFYIILNYVDYSLYDLIYTIFEITTYAAIISLALFVCLSVVRIRGGFKGTRLMIGNRHLHEGTIGIVFVVMGVIWNIWHYFDPNFYFPYSPYPRVGLWLAIGGLVWIIIGAIFIGRDWEDIKKGHFFNKETE